MYYCSVRCGKYDMDLTAVLSRQLSLETMRFAVVRTDEGAFVQLDESAGEHILSAALSRVLLRDLAYFELSRCADELPLTLPEKQEALTEALRLVRDARREARVREELAAFLTGRNEIHLEGYLRFRLKDVLASWQETVERAAGEMLMRREYGEMMEVLRSFAAMQQPRIGELSICLNPDGSCTLSDESDARIEYIDCSEDGIVSLLVSMAPAQLVVYDLSGGTAGRLTEAIARVFSGRVRIYR